MAHSVLSPVLLAPFPRQYSCFLFCFLPPQSSISLTTSSQRTAQCNTRMGSWSPSRYVQLPLQPWLSLPVPCAQWGAAPGPGQVGSLFCPPQMPDLNVPLLQVMFLGGLHGGSSIFLTPPSPPAGHSGPLGGRAAAGSNQLLSQLHGAAEAAQETVTAQAHANGSHITDF